MPIVNVDDLRRIFKPAEDAANRLAQQVESLNRAQEERIAAANGGFTGNGDERQIKSDIRSQKSSLYGEIDQACEGVSEKLAEHIEKCFAIDVFVLKEWGAYFANIDFSDDDLRSIGKTYRNYSMLRGCVSCGMRRDSKFAKALNRELKSYREQIESSAKRLVKAAKNAVKYDLYSSGAFTHAGMWKSGAAAGIFEDIQKINDDFDAFLDGTLTRDYGDPLMNRLAAMADE